MKHFYRMEINKIPPKNSIIILNDFSWSQVLTLFSKIDNLKIITSGKKFKNFPMFNSFSDTINMISQKKFSLTKLKKAADKIEEKDSTLCLLLRNPFELKDIKKTFPDNENIYLMKTKKSWNFKTFLGKGFSRTIFLVTLEKI